MLRQDKILPFTFFSQELASSRTNALWFLLIAMALVGCISLYSSSNQNIELVMKQATWFLLGFIGMFCLKNIPLETYRWWLVWVYLGALLLLVLVYFFGDTVKGAQRWLDLKLFRFQPSELFKVIAPMMVCFLLTLKADYSTASRYALAIGTLLLPVWMISKQPDLGTAILVAIPSFLAIFLSGVSWIWVILTSLLGVISIPVVWHFLLDYQKQRLLTFLYPEQDPLGSGYHIIQSKIAIGSGGLWGKGWLNGTQSQLDFIPERSTDFIFATFAEEFGFVGVCVLFLFYFMIMMCGIKIALNAPDKFGRLLAMSLILAFAFYVFVNIGMVSGLMPVVGMPLPLLSYGGSSTVTLLASFGILLSIAKQKRLIKPPE